MAQGQSQITGEKKEDREIWFTYHSSALKTTREAVALNPNLLVRSEKTDEDSSCVENSLPPCFSKSLLAIVMCVFVLEYRVNQVAQWKKRWNKKINPYFDKNEKEVKASKCRKKKKFRRLSLYEKWRNIVEFSGKPLKPDFHKLIKELNKWIDIRNKIAHADYKKIQNFQISPGEALSCYDTITEAIFGLNIALGYGTKEENDKDCKRMLLRQKNISP